MHRLEAELASKQADMKAESGPSKESLQGYRLAVKLSSEFVSAILVGVFLGWGLDWLAGTWPWGMVIFLMLGFAAGVMNVLRSSGVVKDAASRRQARRHEQEEEDGRVSAPAVMSGPVEGKTRETRRGSERQGRSDPPVPHQYDLSDRDWRDSL